MPDNVEIKRLVKNQLRLFKKLQQRHQAEREDLLKAHVCTPFWIVLTFQVARMMKLDAKAAADLLALTEEQKADFKKLKDKQETDLADLRSSFVLCPAV